MESIIIGLGGSFLLIALVIGAGALRQWWRSREAQRRYQATDDIPLFFPIEASDPSRTPSDPLPEQEIEEFEKAFAQGTIPLHERFPGVTAPRPIRVAERRTSPEAPRDDWESSPTPPRRAGTITRNAPEPASARGGAVRFHEVDARTMRLLPGRLEVEEGEDSRAEIRFVDLPGERAEVTFGRRSGEPFRHVQLQSPTVSRDHAIMTREGTEWVISNLSNTNPIVVNGVELSDPAERHVLRDGDRIEMGEVVFRFYSV